MPKPARKSVTDSKNSFQGLKTRESEVVESGFKVETIPAPKTPVLGQRAQAEQPAISDLDARNVTETKTPHRFQRPQEVEQFISEPGLKIVLGPEYASALDLGQVNRKFPSWSWAGWNGSADYRFFAEPTTTEEPLPMSLIKSYTVNVDQKLRMILTRTLEPTSSPAPGPANREYMLTSTENLPTSLDDPMTANLLQFHAPCVPLTAFTIPTRREYLSRPKDIHITGFQPVRHILDPRGKRCGLWWEQAGYVYIGRNASPQAKSKMLLVGISQHGDIYRPRKGPSRVEGEVRLFDETVYPSVGKGSGLINVLAIDLDMPGHKYAERITVARIHVKAWEEANPQVKLVQLI